MLLPLTSFFMSTQWTVTSTAAGTGIGRKLITLNVVLR